MSTLNASPLDQIFSFAVIVFCAGGFDGRLIEQQSSNFMVDWLEFGFFTDRLIN